MKKILYISLLLVLLLTVNGCVLLTGGSYDYSKRYCQPIINNEQIDTQCYSDWSTGGVVHLEDCTDGKNYYVADAICYGDRY